MISVRRRLANRANARRSTGPKTRAGKVRSSRNALRHGLALPAPLPGGYSREVEELARMIAGSDARCEPARYERACQVAAAQLDLVQVRRARRNLLSASGCDHARAIISDRKLLARLAALDRYEQRALARRRFAIREFDSTAASVNGKK